MHANNSKNAKSRFDSEYYDLRYTLEGSLLEFCKFMFQLRHGREFTIPTPVGRENHVYIVLRELVKVFNLETKNLMVNLPPGHGKSLMLQMFIAWCLAQYPDCHFIYISYSQELAEGHTAEIKAIMQLPIYQKLFNVTVDPDAQARGDFRVISLDGRPCNGRVAARGSAGSITGINAGLPNAVDKYGNPRFSGLAIMDDLHKPTEVHSDVKRELVITNYNQTIKPRRRSPAVGQILLGQVLHEEDITQFIKRGEDGLDWKTVSIPALDEAGNALAPNLMTKEQLLIEKEVNQYMFYSQMQQQPVPAGGSVFKPEWFKQLAYTPQILESFVTVDVAETEKSYNDATVFSFWGIYKIQFNNTDTGQYGLHWIDCRELRIEPKDLESEFLDFWTECLRFFRCPPKIAAIEKKSMGTMLCSTLKDVPGLRIMDIQRSRNSGSKTDRFLECQKHVAGGFVSIHKDAKHKDMVLEHMRKLTANNTHRFDDIGDTACDAIRIALIDKLIINHAQAQTDYSKIGNTLNLHQNTIDRIKRKAFC